MATKIIHSEQHVWDNSNDRYILIIKKDEEIIGLNFCQGDDYELFKAEYLGIDEDLTNFYKAVKPYLDERNSEIDDINAGIWAWLEYKNRKEDW